MGDGTGKRKQASTVVMTYNIQHGVGSDGQLNVQRIADVIRDSGAEIICLQEVDRHYGERSDYKDQVQEMADMLGYHQAYGANLDMEPEEGQTNRRQYGNAIISKYPILRSENRMLSSCGQEQRGILHTVINLKGIYVDVYNTHLGLDVTSRMVQIQEIIELASASQGSMILMGDFNTEPDSSEIQLVLNSGLFVNSFHGIEGAYTYPAFNPSAVIDYILLDPTVQYSNQRVIDTQASDHLPIVVDVSFIR